MDAFYAAVEVLDNPSLKGKPVIVDGSRKRGVVSSASYEARKFGVHSAQPMATATRLCPKGVFLPVRMPRYDEVSDQVFEIFYRFTPLVEPLAVACHDVRLGEIKSGDTGVVLGGGPIGMLVGLVAKSRGAKVILSEPQDFRSI